MTLHGIKLMIIAVIVDGQVKFHAKKSLHFCRLFSIWLHDLDSNQGPND